MCEVEGGGLQSERHVPCLQGLQLQDKDCCSSCAGVGIILTGLDPHTR